MLKKKNNMKIEKKPSNIDFESSIWLLSDRERNRQKSRADIPLFEECGRACQTKRKAGLKISIKLRCTFLPEQDYSTTHIICCCFFIFC